MPIQHDFAEFDQVTLHYAHVGKGRPLLFLHGFPAFWYVWKNQLLHFGKDCWAIAPDGRGVNLSSKPKDVAAYTIDQLAADVAQLADHLNFEQFVLVGHDWGGALAWEVAKRFPEKVSHLVVANAPPFDALLYAWATLAEQRSASDYMTRLKAPTAEALFLANQCELLWQAAFAQQAAAKIYDQSDRAMYQQNWERPGSLTGFLNWYRANVPEFEHIDAEQFKPNASNQINVPTLLLWGEHERAFIRPMLNIIPHYAPNLKIELIAGANHWIFLEKAALANQLIKAFIAG